MCPCDYQGLSALYRSDLCETIAEGAANGHVQSCLRAREEVTKDLYKNNGGVAYLCAGVFCGSSVQRASEMLAGEKAPGKRAEIAKPRTHENSARRREKGAADAHQSVCGLEDLGAAVASGEYHREDVPV